MNRWKQILAPLLVFILGALCGGGGVALYVVKQARQFIQADPSEATKMASALIVRELKLDAGQRAALQPIFNDVAAALVEIRRESVPQIRRVILDAEPRIRPQLRPDQQRRLDELLAAPKARWEILAPEKGAR